MTLRKLRVFICSFGALLALSACFSDNTAVANLPGRTTLTMTVTPMFGFHSDWNRELIINDGDTTVSIDLFEDTGWWRGSHVYLHTSGAYVVHEGQNGCFGFTLDPASFDVRTSISCVKATDVASRLSAEGSEFRGFPASKYYSGLFYVGRFVEAGRVPELRKAQSENPIIFQTHEHQAELELPEIL
ncbi:hypothetical protein K4L02_08015 [Phaeobacter inhibens]|uniref:hypothetical protein n=1 Tax=Phaeobacter inhibens TaxID=221822 RepID=UPI0021A6B5C6|nr:hypothetical protein [Phaeobacter inhibens]UWR66155.1 hypothetical protein K4L02_08015 [Phaeobacter inhibens]